MNESDVQIYIHIGNNMHDTSMGNTRLAYPRPPLIKARRVGEGPWIDMWHNKNNSFRYDRAQSTAVHNRVESKKEKRSVDLITSLTILRTISVRSGLLRTNKQELIKSSWPVCA